jgi:hypothetical protein
VTPAPTAPAPIRAVPPSPKPAAQPVSKPEPVTPSLFAAPPSPAAAHPAPRHPAIPVQNALSGAIRPMFTPQVLPKGPAPAPATGESAAEKPHD